MKGSIKPLNLAFLALVSIAVALVALNPAAAARTVMQNRQLPLYVIGIACIAFGIYQFKTKSVLLQSAKKLGTEKEIGAHDDYLQWAISTAISVFVGICMIILALAGKTIF